MVGATETMIGYTHGAITAEPTEVEIAYAGGSGTAELPANEVE